MNKELFLHKANDKLNAIEYFPDFFEKDYNLKSYKTLDDLVNEFDKNKVFNKDIGIDLGYNYLKCALKENEYQPNTKITNDLLGNYERLTESIADYTFNPNWKNSCGDKQNRTNKQILFDISLLKPMLMNVLEIIDKYLEKPKNNLSELQYEICFERQLEYLCRSLSYAYYELKRAEAKYHRTWHSIARRDYFCEGLTNSDLGEAKLNWKKRKNEACHTILNFHKSMQEINRILYSNHLNGFLNFEQVNDLYNCGIDNIVNGPNYYSYLSDEERKNLDEYNKKGKTMVKNKK